MANKAKMKPAKFMEWWLDPKNGKVGQPFTNKKTGKVGITRGFHSVTSGFNDVVQQYYGKTGKEFLEELVSKELVSIRPVSGVKGVMVYPFRQQSESRATDLLTEMGLS